MKYLFILLALPACATYQMGEYEPIPGPNYNAETWEENLRICEEKLSMRRRGEGAYRYEFNECMKRLGQDVDWRASEKKYRDK